MKIVGVTQRVDTVAAYKERRDALDQQWWAFLNEVDVLSIPLPNYPNQVAKLLQNLPFDGFILSGGNDLLSGGSEDNPSPERDGCEQQLLGYARDRRLPVIGVCRGMQMINLFFGGSLENKEGHVGIVHELKATTQNSGPWQDGRFVNSFHRASINETSLAGELEVLAKTDDGVVEALRHSQLPVFGIMWHPERETPFDNLDLIFFKKVLGC